jgi:hypothetical protein
MTQSVTSYSAPPLWCSFSPVYLLLHTPATIVTRTCVSPGLHHFYDSLPYICHSLWIFPQAVLVSHVQTLLLFCIVLFIIKVTPCTCFLTPSVCITQTKSCLTLKVT